MRFIRGIGFDWITAHESALLAYGTEALSAVPGVRLVGTAPDKASILSFVMDGVHPHDIGTIVDQRGRGHPHRPPLRAAGDGPLRHPGHRAGVAGDVQHHRRRRPPGRGAPRRAEDVRMMSGLSELYQEVILDHNRRPRNFRADRPAPACQEGYNPLCGDRLTVYVRVDDGRHQRRRLRGQRLRHLQGLGVADDRGAARAGRSRRPGRWLRCVPADGHLAARQHPCPSWASSRVLAGVREFPTRVKCASLAWHTVRAALDGRGGRPRSPPSSRRCPVRRG